MAVEAGNYAPWVYLALAIAQRLGGSVEQLFGEQSAAERPGLGDGVGADV